jgi:carbon-monoxide dehydrogenase medium subunit
MLLPQFDVVEPESLAAALEALADPSATSRPLAGGTDAVPDLKREYDRRLRFPALPAFRPGPFPERFVSLLRLEELRGVRRDDGGAVFGPLATMRELADGAAATGALGALADAAAAVGSPQVRNRATLGGNLCNARPCADTAPAVVVLDAALTLASRGGRREVPAGAFFTGPGQTVLRPGELLTSVRVPPEAGACGSAALKLGVRRAYEIAIVSAAAWVALEGDRVREARVAFASVAPIPLRVGDVGLAGRTPDEATLREAARAAAAQTRPIDDFRASAAYRRQAAEVLAFRVLARAVARARGTA